MVHIIFLSILIHVFIYVPFSVTTPLPYKYETLITPRELYFHSTPAPYSHSTPAPYSHSTPAPYSHSTPAPYSHSTPAPIFTTHSPFLHSAPSYHSRPSRHGPYTAEKDRFEFKKELPYVSSLPKTQYGPNHLGGGHIETSDVGHFGILTGSHLGNSGGSHLGNSGGSHIGISGGSHLGNPSSSVQSANYGNKEFITHTGNLRNYLLEIVRKITKTKTKKCLKGVAPPPQKKNSNTTPLTIVLLADISDEEGLENIEHFLCF